MQIFLKIHKLKFIIAAYIILRCNMKSIKTRKLKNATIKRRRYQRGGVTYIHTSRIHQNGRYNILAAETDDHGTLVNLYMGQAKIIYPALPQTCAHEGICSSPEPIYLFHGKGIMYTLDQNNQFLVYKGNFKNSLRSGKGTQTWFRSNGVIDHGIRTLHDLESMTMDQVNQILHSLSTHSDILEIYDGTWKNGTKHGKGKLLSNIVKILYVGDFQNNMKHGKGKMKFDKSIYTGDFQNGMMHGNGKLIYLEGPAISYDGGWYENQMHGLGQYVYRDGERLNVRYENGNVIDHGF